MASRVRDATRSIAASIGTIQHPVSGQTVGSIGETQLAIGMGVHGESGLVLDDDISADEVSALMIGRLVEDANALAGSRVALLVNNAGSLTLMELSILYRGARAALSRRGIRVARSWIGSYATTLDQAGFGIAILSLDRDMEELYDAPANGAAFAQLRASQ